jgi:hypothetical protein
MKKGEQFGNFAAVKFSYESSWSVIDVSTQIVKDLGMTRKEAEAVALDIHVEQQEAKAVK